MNTEELPQEPSRREGSRLAHEQLAIFGLAVEAKQSSLLLDLALFVKWGGSYFLHKLSALTALIPRLLSHSLEFGALAKAYVVRKLVWGRGRLSGSAIRVSVFGLVFFVLLVGSTGWAQSRVLIAPFGQKEDILVEAAVAGPITFTNTSTGEPIHYIVKEGDTLSSIGEQFKVSVASIVSANNISNINFVKPGQELTVPPVTGLLHTVKKGDTVESLAAKYSVAPQSVVDFNYLFAPFTLTPGDILVVPGGTVPTPKPAPRQYAQGGEEYRGAVSSLGTGDFAWPTNYRSISQYFSRWHPAIDVPKFSPIYAIDSGTVVEVRYSGWNYGYGRMVRIDHGNGYRSLYAHLSSISIQPGQKVSRGQVIGNMGASGRAYGTHLHIEITKDGRHINPLSVL